MKSERSIAIGIGDDDAAVAYITVSALYFGAVRAYLRRFKFIRPEIEFYESSGWFQREFIVRGPEVYVRRIYGYFSDLEQAMKPANGAAS